MTLAIAAATDFILSILPIMFLWNVKLPLRVKFGICAIMALGFAYAPAVEINLPTWLTESFFRSGAFAIVRTALVPNLTATHDPTCM